MSELHDPPGHLIQTGHHSRGRRLVWGLGLLAGTLVMALVCGMVILGRWFVAEISKADPIPGIAVNVDPGNAVDAKRIDHATRSFLHRRLRAAGFDRPGVGPLRIDVKFKKIGTLQYQTSTTTVTADRVEVEVTFFDGSGRQLGRVTAQPKMYATEQYKYDTEISLNQAAYGRAVSEILHMKLPGPEIARGRREGAESVSRAGRPPSLPRQGGVEHTAESRARSPVAERPARRDPHLLVHIPFEEEGGNEIRNAGLIGWTGEVVGPARWVDGPVGRALRFDGGTHVDFRNMAPFERTSPFSISVWVRRTSDKGMKIVSRLDELERGYDLAMIRGVVWFQLLHSLPDNCLQVTTAAAIPPDTWRLVVATYDGSSRAAGVRVYVDGQVVRTNVRRDKLTQTIVSNGRFRIGKHTKARYGDFEGCIDDVRIFNRELPASDVIELYRQSSLVEPPADEATSQD